MADFNNFTSDEHLILNAVLVVDELINEHARVTGCPAKEIKTDAGISGTLRLQSISDDDAKKLLQRYRDKIEIMRQS